MPSFKIRDYSAAVERRTLNQTWKALASQRSNNPGPMRAWVRKMQRDMVKFRLMVTRDRAYDAEVATCGIADETATINGIREGAARMKASGTGVVSPGNLPSGALVNLR